MMTSSSGMLMFDFCFSKFLKFQGKVVIVSLILQIQIDNCDGI